MSWDWRAEAEPIPGYRLRERLGRGGFGEVWVAEAPGGLLKAIKFVYGNLSGESDHQAAQELKALSRIKLIRHPFIISIDRYDVIEGRLMIVMELADCNLRQRLNQCLAQGLPGIPREELLRYLTESAEALDMMNHQHDLQHLDIKPENLFLIGSHIKVADFGLVKDLEGCSASITGGVTPIYAAPETFEGRVSRTTDQYSLAIVYQEMLTGVRPFQATTARQYMMQHLTAEPDLTPLPIQEREIVYQALEKEPNRRHATCAAFVEQLRRVGDRRTFTGPAPTVSPPLANGVPDPQPALNKLPALDPETTTPFVAPNMAREPVSPSHPTEMAPPKVAPANRIPSHTKPKTTTPLGPETTQRDKSEDAAAEAVRSTLCQSGFGSRAKDHPTSVHTLANLPHLEQFVSSDGNLVPTLCVGLGRTGLDFLMRLRRRLKIQQHQRTVTLPIRTLGLDCDPRVFEELSATLGMTPAESHELQNQTVLCKLRKPNQYLEEWDRLKSISSWLDPQFLYQIGINGTSEAQRALGRLAFCDHSRRLVARFRFEIEALLNLEYLQSVTSAYGERLRGIYPKICLIGHMGGGLGSGMFIDACYLAQKILAEMGIAEPEIEGYLVVGETPNERDLELRRLNHYALAQDLLNLYQPDAEFCADFEGTGTAQRFQTPPTSTCYFFDTSNDMVSEPQYEVVQDTMVEFIFQLQTQPFGRVMSAHASLGKPLPPFRSVGWFTLNFSQTPFLKRMANQLAQTTVERWLAPIQKTQSEKLRQTALAGLQETHYSGEWVAEKLDQDCARRLGCSIEAMVEQELQQICESVQAAAPSENVFAKMALTTTMVTNLTTADTIECPPYLQKLREEVGRARRRIKQLICLDPGEQAMGEDRPVIETCYRDASRTVAEELLEPLLQAVAQSLDQAHPRLEVALNNWQAINEFLQGLIDNQEGYVEEIYQELRKFLGEARGQLQRAVLANQVATLQQLLRDYATIKRFYLRQYQVLQTLLVLRGRISDCGQELNTLRQRVEQLLELLTKNASNQQEEVWSSIVQPIFPGGVPVREEALLQWQSQIGRPEQIAMEARLYEELLRGLGGLWKFSSLPSRAVQQTAVEINEIIVDWIQQNFELPDVLHCFFDRHENIENSQPELQLFQQWSRPSVLGRERNLHRVVCDQARWLTFLILPESEFQQQLQINWNAATRQTNAILLRSPRDSHFVQVLGHESLGHLLPMWLLKTRRIYERACQTRLSPVIFPDFSASQVS